ncbi:RTA1 domain-containing protein [Colletotrichum graminicola]|uniref:RTA1 domain-containing protein n=1 Tax=Colletotrichum graminicola (strain M1.001 / M2 / FGSC 10212) TaxID=645133 RepID=E3QDW1_COLGM|nr:RTA1 domain-containing protein [Colletotrichum graminicola M1.001]EFQ29049.1 RTA1 domain-containing protein [Colletotrichum graminicola M1.001]WDK20126.1 RTA1 domain-containing protein [Colletotrichum graminicola]
MRFSSVILAAASSAFALALQPGSSPTPTLLGHVNIPAKTIEIAIPTCIQTIKPDVNGYVPPGECGAIWNYYPSFVAAAVFAVLFALLTAVHIWQTAKHKKQSDGVYLVFQIFILLAPIWVNAFAYMTLGRMIYFFHPSRSLLSIPASSFAAIFVVLDIVSFAVQLAGGSMAGPTAPPAEQMKAIHIYMGGIGLQEFFILIFVGLALKFQLEIQKMDRFRGAQPRPWEPLMWALYFSLGMITIRIIYRLVDFSSGHGVDNALITHEAYFYVLEALPMFLAIAVFSAVHPAAVMNGAGSDMPGVFLTIKNGFSKRNGRMPLKEDVEEQELTRRRSPSS